MYRTLAIFSLLVAAVLSSDAQSGRRVVAPAPTVPVVVETDQFSESKPRPARVRSSLIPGRSASTSQVTDDTTETDEGGEEILRIETKLITIPVSVFDRNGLYIPGLRQSEFKIFENGVEQEIEYFGTTDKPFTVALLLDVSPSTEYRIEDIRRAAIAFVDQLQPQDSVIVIDFDQGVRVRTDATQDRQKIYKAINKASFGNGTSLYNAVDEALRKRLGKIDGRKAIVLFTDGVDTTSRRSSYDKTLNYAEEADTLIFPIYYNTYLETRRQNTGRLPNIFGGPVWASGTTAEEYALGRRYLEEMADATGGRVFRPESTPGGLTRAFEGIAEELRRQYNIGFIPKDEGTPGQRKQIKVRVYRPNLLIRARDSYIVGAQPAKQASR